MEQIRRAVRRVLGWDSWLYRRGSQFLNIACLLRSEGLGTAYALTRLGTAPAGPAEMLCFSRLDHPFHIRPGTKDVSVAINNFVREEYGSVAPGDTPRVLVDAGAYIGDTSSYFLSRYPSLRSIALEPMFESIEMARRNLAPYGNRALLCECALTADGATVHMSGEQTGARVSANGGIEVPSVTIPKILADLPEGRIDILKMDIEGAEGPIFASTPEAWLPNVGLIIVKTHGPESTATVLGALSANGWVAERRRNLYFCHEAARGL